MSAQDNEINRDIDTAEGHVRARLEETDDAVERAVIRHDDALDDEAEGHRRTPFLEDDEDAGKRRD